MYLQRDVILVQFPFTDLEGSKLRPALVISSANVNALHDLVCVQITSKLFNDEFFLPIIDDDLTSPLKLKSGIRLHKIFTVNEQIILRKISSFNSIAFDRVITQLSGQVLKKD
jgi:mRNA interferase MazF